MPPTPDAVILCGGLGLRLRSVTGDTPKTMVSVCGRPFMELLLVQLKRNGFSRVILSTGFRSDVIRNHFGEKAFGLDLLYSLEPSPLGTGGALRHSWSLITTDSILVMNGDSHTDLDLRDFMLTHARRESDLTVAVVPETRTDAGSVLVDDNGRVTAFAEKHPLLGSRFKSAGIYMISSNLAESIPPAVHISLEERLLPRWIREGRIIKAFIHPGKCMDIGTPARYWGAQQALAGVELEASLAQSEDNA